MENISNLIEALEELNNCNGQEAMQMLIERRFQDLTNSEANADAESSIEIQNNEVVSSRRGYGLLALEQWGKHVKDLNKQVKKLNGRGKFPEGIAFHNVFHDRGNIFPVEKLVTETSKIMMQEVMDCLMDDSVGKIGVCGMGGVGKTTVMKHINNLLMVEEKRKFDFIIWVTVSRPFSIIRLQSDIAKILHVDLSNYEDETSRSANLFAALEARKRYVLILDDVWEDFILEHIGIPEPTPSNGCKLVLTTRSLDVCRIMSCKAIRMDLLSVEESWNLFIDYLGNDVLLTEEVKRIVEDVANECARLPLAIVTVARGMSGVDESSEWRNALEKLRAIHKEPHYKEKQVIERLKFSFDLLTEKKFRDCLLYCSLYPEDYNISRVILIELLILEGIIKEKKTKQAEFDEGHAILTHLENVCLLEGGSFDGSTLYRYVKMHDLIRDMTLYITSIAPRFMVEAGLGLKELPEKEKWSDDLMKVSLAQNEIFEISKEVSPMCPNLSTLMLHTNFQLKAIPNSFFKHLHGIKVLNLCGTSITYLSNAVSDLINLIALWLECCTELAYVPSLARLKYLRSLNLGCTSITKVPNGLEKLSNLRYLNLASESLKMIPDGIIPKLSRLQQLILWYGGEKSLKGPKVRVEELMSLKHLESFHGELDDKCSLNACDSLIKILKDYNIEVGSHSYSSLSTFGDPSDGIRDACIIL